MENSGGPAGERTSYATMNRNGDTNYALYQAVPNAEVMTLSPGLVR